MKPRTLLLGLIAAAVAACGDSPTGPSALQTRNIAGAWNYSESFSNASAGISCQATGTIVINQSSANFTGSSSGSGVCTDSWGNTIDSSGAGGVSGGQISGIQVAFSAGPCEYSGTISGTPTNRMSGSVSCVIAAGGTNYPFTGTWTATR